MRTITGETRCRRYRFCVSVFFCFLFFFCFVYPATGEEIRAFKRSPKPPPLTTGRYRERFSKKTYNKSCLKRPVTLKIITHTCFNIYEHLKNDNKIYDVYERFTILHFFFFPNPPLSPMRIFFPAFATVRWCRRFGQVTLFFFFFPFSKPRNRECAGEYNRNGYMIIHGY